MHSTQDWHRRYRQQAGWTQQLRQYLFGQINLGKAQRILEVGCGTGAVLADLPDYTQAGIYGLDRHFQSLRYARLQLARTHLAGGNGLFLPYPDACFDVTFCHFYLLWLNDPLAALKEMRRVTQPGGFVLALAEPDYGARIDYPPALEPLGVMQARSLAEQGADPQLGRKLASLFHQAELHNVHAGVLGSQWSWPADEQQRELEWQVLRDDLVGQFAPNELSVLEAAEDQASKAGERILYVPTFYAWGQVP